jgi:hypothetical protein
MDARESPIRTRPTCASQRGTVEADSEAEIMQERSGASAAKSHIAGSGNSIARMLGTADGDAR